MTNLLQISLQYYQQGQFDRAIEQLHVFLKNNSKNAYAHFLLAVIYTQKHLADEAIQYFEKAIEQQNNYPEAYNNLGVVLESKNRTEDARKCYKQAINLNKLYANPYYNIANIENKMGNIDLAIDFYNKAIKYNPQYSNAMNNLALIYQSRGNFKKSRELLHRASTFSEQDPELLTNLAYNDYCQFQLEDALTSFNNILNTHNNYPPAILNKGLLLQSTGNLPEARKLFHQLTSNPEYQVRALHNLAHLELSNKYFEQGWQYYRSRPSIREKLADTCIPDEIKNRSILILKDQGLGDEIFFSRYLSHLTKVCAKVAYVCDSKLLNIWNDNLSEIDIVDINQESSETQKTLKTHYDYVISISDLPLILSNIIGYQPIASVHLNANKNAVDSIKNQLPNNEKINIAVTWQAGTEGHNRLFKRISPGRIGDILKSIDANIIIIQRDPRSSDIKLLERHLGRKTFNYAYLNNNINEMLALLSVVDKYICVSNTNLHLHAALGKSAHVFIPFPAEWRWLAQGASTPWFPSLSIYRQDISGNWDAALNSFQNCLNSSLNY